VAKSSEAENHQLFPDLSEVYPLLGLTRVAIPSRRGDVQAMTDELPFKIVRSNGTDELLARAMNLLIARGAYRSPVRMYPEYLIELRQGAHVIERSK
jgi:uncharacterized protein (DUF2236 family)